MYVPKFSSGGPENRPGGESVNNEQPIPAEQKTTAQELIAANIQALIAQLEAGNGDALTAYPDAMNRSFLPTALLLPRAHRAFRKAGWTLNQNQHEAYRRAWSSKRPSGAESSERYGRALPAFFPIGHRGGAIAFTPSGAAVEISRPPPPSQAPGPISQKSLSWHGITPPLGSSCTPRPSGQYVPTGQKPI
jgi:hypothetical protein